MPTLYLIPTPLGAPDAPCLLPHELVQISHLTDFIVEAEKTPARRARFRASQRSRLPRNCRPWRTGGGFGASRRL